MAETPYRRRIGDRKEGRLLRSISAINKLVPFIMITRNDACNYFRDEIEITEIDRWLRQKRKEGYKGIGIMHLFIAAYIRTVASRPALNRFVSGRRVYARNCVEIIMTIKHSLSDESEESVINVKFQPTDTIYDVYRKMNDDIDAMKAQEGGNDTDKLADAFTKLPRFILSFAIGLLKFLDYFGLLPQMFLDASPFHGSMVITDLGSIGIPPVFHHLYNFGNLPIFIAFGAKRRKFELDESGHTVESKYVDFTATTDERICDGFYLATSFKYLKHYLNNPHLLETPPERVDQDVF